MKYRVLVEERTFEVEIGPDGRVWVDRQPVHVDMEGIDGLPQYSLLVNHRSYEAHVEAGDDGYRVTVAGRPYRTALQDERPAARRPSDCLASDGPSDLVAPLPGLLVEVRVTDGQCVQRGDVVAVLESMKMNLELRAPRSGTVRLFCTGGREVAQGEVLAVVGGTAQT